MILLRSSTVLCPQCIAAFAQTQTTTSHPVTGGSGTATTPTRISLAAMGGTQFFESGYGPSCSGQTTQALEFVLLNGGNFGAGVCAPVTNQPVGSCGNLYAEFYGVDAAGVHFKGSLNLTTTCQYVRLRYSKTMYTVAGGMLTITQEMKLCGGADGSMSARPQAGIQVRRSTWAMLPYTLKQPRKPRAA